MRKLLFALLILLVASSSFAGGGATMMMIGGTAAGGGVASYGAELNTTQTASSPAGVSEANATTGWAAAGTGTFESSTTAPSLGTYHISAIANANGGKVSYALGSLGLTGGTLYKIAFGLRHNGTGGAWSCGFGASTDTYQIMNWTIDNTADAYTHYSVYFLSNGTEDTLGCKEASASDDGGMYIDNVSIKAATPCSGDELHTAANAAAIGAEANATTGWSNINTLNSFTSDGTGPHGGSYHILANAMTSSAANNGFNIDLAFAPFSLQDGTKYVVRFWARHITAAEGGGDAGDAWQCGHSNTSTGAANTTNHTMSLAAATTTYAEYGWDVTYSSTFRYFVCTEAGANNNGGIYLDDFSVKAITGE